MRFLSFSRRLVRVDRGDELRRLEGEAKVEDNLPMVASPAAPRSHPHRFLAAATFAPVLLLSSCRTLERDPPVALGAIDQPTFALIDVDGDGRVSPSEMAKYKHAEGLAEIDLNPVIVHADGCAIVDALIVPQAVPRIETEHKRQAR